MAFLASPMALPPEAEAASRTQNKTHKVKAGKAKSKTAKTGKAKAKKVSLKSARKGFKASKRTRVVAENPNTPLRTLKVSYDNSWQDNDLDLKSAAALVVDQKSGEALYAKNVEVATPIASITKLMTAMVALDARLPLDEEIVISADDMDRLKGTGSRLALGTRLTREELLHLALIASENRAAAALSRAYPGGRDAFIAAMNRKAREIGMKQAHFVDGTGLNSDNRATASDLVRMVDAAYQYPLIRQISSAGSYDVSVPGRKVVRVKEKGKVRRVAEERHPPGRLPEHQQPDPQPGLEYWRFQDRLHQRGGTLPGDAGQHRGEKGHHRAAGFLGKMEPHRRCPAHQEMARKG
jgi:D-alanyl-D-alanine endopeptidase (penicillin-binding protein 7)